MMKYIYGGNSDYRPEEELELLRKSLASEREMERPSWAGLFRGVNMVCNTFLALPSHLTCGGIAHFYTFRGEQW